MITVCGAFRQRMMINVMMAGMSTVTTAIRLGDVGSDNGNIIVGQHAQDAL